MSEAPVAPPLRLARAAPELVSTRHTPSPERVTGPAPAALAEALRSRILFKTLDAATTAPLGARGGAAAALGRALDPRASHYARARALVRLAGAVLPGLSAGIGARLLRAERLPFAGVPVELLDFGSGATVFRVAAAGGAPPRVLKVYRRSLGRRPATLLEIARTFQRKYQTVASWYAGPHRLLPASAFLILHGPLLGRGAVACLQEFVEGETRDFFEDHSDAELVDLLLDEDELRAAFQLFATRTLRVRAEQGVCVDLLGRENLLLVRHGGRLGLRLIDFGIFDLGQKRSESPVAHARICDHLERMEALLHAIR